MAARAEQTADPAPPSSPPVPDIADDLADMLRAGRVCGPAAVLRVEYTLTDGRRVAVDLPAPRAAEGREDDGLPDLKELERDILRVLRQSGRRMLALDIAGVIDPDQDPYDGSFSRAIKRLKELELIDGGKTEGGYALKTK